MRVTGVTANLPVSDIEAARSFYADYLGLGVEEMNLGWVARYRSWTDGLRFSSSHTTPRVRWTPCFRFTSGMASTRPTPKRSVADMR